MLPFFYTVSCHISKAFDSIEIIELPIVDPKLMVSEASFEELESKFVNIGVVHCASQQKIDSENIFQEIYNMRRSAISKISDLIDSKGIMTFSMLKNISENIKNNDTYGYLKYCTHGEEHGEEKKNWHYRSECKVPFIDKKELFMFYLDSWDLSVSALTQTA